MAGDYIVHKAVEAAKVKKGRLQPLNTYEQQAKCDGCCALLFFDSEGKFVEAKSRTGEPAQSMNIVGRELEKAAKSYLSRYNRDGVVLIGEAWWPGKGEFNKISGEFRRYAESPNLWLIINDVIPLEHFNAGHSPLPYNDRVAEWRGIRGSNYRFTEYWPAGSGDPQERCNQLVQAGGHDGLILRDPVGLWTIGRGTTGEIIKVKQKLSFDLRVLEVNTVKGEKTGRDVYKLVVDFRGLRLGVGSGLPHDLSDVPQVGQIVEIGAMDYSSDGLLREPRYKGVRFDKLEPDN